MLDKYLITTRRYSSDGESFEMVDVYQKLDQFLSEGHPLREVKHVQFIGSFRLISTKTNKPKDLAEIAEEIYKLEKQQKR